MASRKRSRQANDPFGDPYGDECTLTVTLAPADGWGPKQELLADQHIIRSCSVVGAGLPSDAAVWDLSTMLVDMEPVTRATVVAWLNCAYQRIAERDFEPQGQDEMGTAVGLCKLLAFADAVGSRRGIVSACAEFAQDVQLVVTIPIPANPAVSPTVQQVSTTIRLLTDGGAYSIEPLFEGAPAGLFEGQLFYSSALERYSLGALLPYKGIQANEQAVQRLLLAAAQQTEALLFEAQRLELHALKQRMLRFIAACACNSMGIFHDMLDEIFTDRVLDAMLPPGATQANKDSWISSVLSLPCGFTDGPSINKLFEAQQIADLANPYSLRGSLEPNTFNAVLCEDLMGASSGDRVPVELDLFRTGTMRIGNMQWPVQLLLGAPTST